MELIDIYGISTESSKIYIFFSSGYKTISRTEHILGYNTNNGKFNKTENKTESIFITISYRNQLQEKSCKKHKYMKAKQYATKSPNEK